MEFKELEEENENLRKSIGYSLSEKGINNSFMWERINQLIKNEIKQEKYCNQ